MAGEYICVDENFYHLERDTLSDRFSWLTRFFTRKLIYKVNSLYNEGDPRIKEYLGIYRWLNADFDPDRYKKIDEWLK